MSDQVERTLTRLVTDSASALKTHPTAIENPERATVRALRVVTWTLLIGAHGPSLSGQDPGGLVTGAVYDSLGHPISDVLVFLDRGETFVTTGSIGVFRLELLELGEHTLSLRGAGLAPRTFRLSHLPGQERIDVGPIVLDAGPDPSSALSGIVTDGTTGEPLEGAEVRLNGAPVATSGRDGTFAVTTDVAWGANELRVGGLLAYSEEASDFWFRDPGESFHFTTSLTPSPILLDGLVAETNRPPPVVARLHPFLERLEEGRGQFVTRADIEARDARRLSDTLRGLNGVRFIQRLAGVEIRLARGTAWEGCSSPLFYVDGAFVGGGRDYVDIDDLAAPAQVEGIEVYGGAAAIPVELARPGSACGVIAIWTR